LAWTIENDDFTSVDRLMAAGDSQSYNDIFVTNAPPMISFNQTDGGQV
jgi:hypothetical protein